MNELQAPQYIQTLSNYVVIYGISVLLLFLIIVIISFRNRSIKKRLNRKYFV
jgi:ascorbate-specific PTS system EIIC-type component UlaA